MMTGIRLALSPHGRIFLWDLPVHDRDAETESLSMTWKRMREAFAFSSANGLWLLIPLELEEGMGPEIRFWKQWARQVVQAFCYLDEEQQSQLANKSVDPAAVTTKLVPPPDALSLAVTVSEAPPMHGLEYLTADVLRQLWRELSEFVRQQAICTPGGLVALLKLINPQWQLLGRVTFHLAENKKDPDRPFAFLATYSHRLSAAAKIKHLPLAEALRQYAGKQDQSKLAELLIPVRQASERSALVQEWLESRQLFHPHALTIEEAYRFLRDVPQMEQCGLVVRVPDWWRARHRSHPTIQIHLGHHKPDGVGASALLDFSIDFALDGERLTDKEQQQLLAADDGLTLLRGRWVEVDQQRLHEALAHWQRLKAEHADGIEFLRGMRMLAGVSLDGEPIADRSDHSQVLPGSWLSEILASIRNPAGKIDCQPGRELQATLRPYQTDGVRWLWFMTQLRLGACLADDMGLGKTIQIIDLLLQSRRQQIQQGRSADRQPHLLIVPASLIGNWKQEFSRFAPQLKILFAHRSEVDAALLDRLDSAPQRTLRDFDAVLTSYALARTATWPGQIAWDFIVLDEAQAIKSASSAQTRAVKKLRSNSRIILTGTPVENHLGDLWSLFDFCSPGLLGNSRQFKQFARNLDNSSSGHSYGALRRLVQPYILRRMKTDPAIAPDLPDKTEMRVDCGLSKQQAVLYQKTVQELARHLESLRSTDKQVPMRRRGIVLSTMMQLKQICNHPSQFLSQDDFPAEESGKFRRLAELCEPIHQRQEKALVFTQFQSMCEPLSRYLASQFGRRGMALHGGTPVGRRKELVQQFQHDDDVPYFVISLKAGGTGLNLTAASHVIHFDRWWNPAVENQATDRAFRIGQRRNVIVHKFVCRGTLEERIDEMLQTKQELADEILGAGQEGERMLTEMSDNELITFVSLNVESAKS